MKKYSKYNVAKNLKTMICYKEVIQEMNTGKISVANLYELEAKIRLYHSLFKDYGVETKDKEEFEKRKATMLKELSADDMKEYIANVNHKVEDDYYDAMVEFQNRIHHIDPNSADGKEENPVAFDIEKLNDDVDYAYPLTRYKKLKNFPINRNYKCVDEGIYSYDKQSADWIRVADAISMKSLPVDHLNNRQYIELEYYNSHRGGTVSTITISIDELSKAKYETLQNAGMVIDNAKYLTKYFNDLRSINHITKKIPYTVAAMCYDFATDEKGNIDFDTFVGMDPDAQIIKMPEFHGLDLSIAASSGTVEGFIEFLTEVSKGIYEMDFQLMVAASLAGVTQSMVNGRTNMTAPISVFASGKTSIGKNLLAAICNNIWCSPSETSLRISSDSSTAYMNSVKNRSGVILQIIDDTADLFMRLGSSELVNLIFSHSNGRAGGKCVNTGTPRPDLTWKCPLITFGEVAMLGNEAKVNGGTDARVLIIDLNYNKSKGQDFLTVKHPKQYLAMENKNYGVYGPAFIEEIKKIGQEKVLERFLDIAEDFASLGAQDKQCNSLALLTLTLEILRDAKLAPATWIEADAITVLTWVGAKEVKDPTDIMYKYLSEYVFGDPSYLACDDHWMTVEAKKTGRIEADIFAAKAKTTDAVRGRLFWQNKDSSGNWAECKKPERERTLLLIPKLELQQLFNYLIKETELTGFSFDKQRWIDNEWLLAGNDGPFLQRDTFKISITRPRDPKNRERYYAIVLKEEKDA